MDIDGYTIERDEEFSYGEQYWVYKDGKLKGWICFFLGILRITFCSDKDEKLGSPFLFHERYGDEVVDEFSTSKERRKAFRLAVKLLEEHYGEKAPIMKTIATIFPGAVVVPQEAEQISMF